MSHKGGLSFLNKKKWHTKKLSNIEKVWLAEKDDKEEKEKILSLKREKALEEKKKYYRNLDNDKPSIDPSIEWMYSTPDLGSDILGALNNTQSTLTNNTQSNNNDNPSSTLSIDNESDIKKRVREDPLLLIKSKQKEQLHSVMNNPWRLYKDNIKSKSSNNDYKRPKTIDRNRNFSHSKKPLSQQEIEKKINEFRNNATTYNNNNYSTNKVPAQSHSNSLSLPTDLQDGCNRMGGKRLKFDD